MKNEIRRGDIFYADLTPSVGSEQGGVRPVVIIQNDVGNQHSPTVIAAAITSRVEKRKLPTHIKLYGGQKGLHRDSVILLEQVRTLDRTRLREYIGRFNAATMQYVDHALAVSFGLEEFLEQNHLSENNVEHRREMKTEGNRGMFRGGRKKYK